MDCQPNGMKELWKKKDMYHIYILKKTNQIHASKIKEIQLQETKSLHYQQSSAIPQNRKESKKEMFFLTVLYKNIKSY